MYHSLYILKLFGCYVEVETGADDTSFGISKSGV
jgi:hypothetical protein